jgi:hypothetical protein
MATKKALCSNPNASWRSGHHVDVSGPDSADGWGARNHRKSLIANDVTKSGVDWQTGAEVRPSFGRGVAFTDASGKEAQAAGRKALGEAEG